MKRALLAAIVIALCLSSVSVMASGSSLPASRLYQPNEVTSAIAMIREGKVARSAVLDAVLMRTSMGITTPNIDPELIAKNIPISQLSSDFSEALVQHGVVPDGSMTLSEFEALEATWPLTTEDVEIALRLYPELDYDRVSTWTYGDYLAYRRLVDLEDLKTRFTSSQLRELERRGIRIEDTFALFKEFHNPEVILAQSDETLKAKIALSYDVKLGMLGIESDVTITSDPPPEYASYYTWVDFPRYGGDWFLNSVLTTEYWRNKQADRALRTQQVLYGSTSTILRCTNMYGTYSDSQGGAHEGIDFAIGTTPPIYAAFGGIRITGRYTHHLAVYDVNSPDEPKTYSYVHMSQISVPVGSTVNPYQRVGNQGNLGNATGYHVHFEVHAGNTNTLSSGSDHVLGSISPYRLQDYIGELQN